MKKQKYSGKDGFEKYYKEKFNERWDGLKAALLAESKQVAYTENLLQPYYLDYASIQAALALPKLEIGICLDMCAAPGGKTLVLSNTMGKDVEIIANELSADRRNRLINVLDEHLPAEKRQQIRVTGYDASKMSKYGQNLYDRILLDAPCSSERHVLQKEKYLIQWTENRIKGLAQRQWSLLSAAFLILKPQGYLVYSTCALSELENDGVLEKLLKKYKNSVELIPAKNNKLSEIDKETTINTLYEKTKYGNIFLPDRAKGAGPIFFSVIKKI